MRSERVEGKDRLDSCFLKRARVRRWLSFYRISIASWKELWGRNTLRVR